MESKKTSLIKSLMDAGYRRAEMVYETYIDNKKEFSLISVGNDDFDLKALEESFLNYYLEDGRPRPQSMIDWLWPDNLNQIFCDDFCEVEIDKDLFPFAYASDVINEMLSFNEQCEAIEKGAKQFIVDTYGKEYLES